MQNAEDPSPFLIIAAEFDRLKARARGFIERANKEETVYSRKEMVWKLLLIVGTGVLAIANLIFPLFSNASWFHWELIPAILAISIGVVANIDSYRGYGRLTRQHSDIARGMRSCLYRHELQWKLRVESEENPPDRFSRAREIVEAFGGEIIQIISSFEPYDDQPKKISRNGTDSKSA